MALPKALLSDRSGLAGRTPPPPVGAPRTASGDTSSSSEPSILGPRTSPGGPVNPVPVGRVTGAAIPGIAWGARMRVPGAIQPAGLERPAQGRPATPYRVPDKIQGERTSTPAAQGSRVPGRTAAEVGSSQPRAAKAEHADTIAILPPVRKGAVPSSGSANAAPGPSPLSMAGGVSPRGTVHNTAPSPMPKGPRVSWGVRVGGGAAPRPISIPAPMVGVNAPYTMPATGPKPGPAFVVGRAAEVRVSASNPVQGARPRVQIRSVR